MEDQKISKQSTSVETSSGVFTYEAFASAKIYIKKNPNKYIMKCNVEREKAHPLSHLQ